MIGKWTGRGGWAVAGGQRWRGWGARERQEDEHGGIPAVEFRGAGEDRDTRGRGAFG